MADNTVAADALKLSCAADKPAKLQILPFEEMSF
jgi:hypothetical protein